jgi:hypothetical protein
MRSRLVAILLVLMLMTGLVSAVQAQNVDCYNLGEADCALLDSATANTATISSARVNGTVTFSLTGLEALAPGTGDITGNLGLSGPIAVRAGAVPPLATSMELTADVSIPGEDAMTGTMGMAIVDGIIYVQDPESSQWIGLPFEQIEQMAGAEMPFPLSSLFNPAATSFADLFNMEMLEGFAAAAGGSAAEAGDMSALADLPGFINFQRLADENLMNQNMAVFSLDMDLAVLFNTPEFMEGLNQGLAAAGGADPSMAQIGAMLPLVLQNSTLTVNVSQWVGLDDNYIHQNSLTVKAEVDLSALMGTTIPPINFDLTASFSLDEINGTFDIVAPEGATVMPASGG